MIPKLIHYCWFGPGRIPQDHAAFIAHWGTLMPDYEIRLWSERNCPDNPYLQSALQNRKWANAANWMRLAALKEHGGIYLDTDIEVLQRLDPFLSNEAFLGFEVSHIDWDGCVNNAVFGSSPGHWFVSELLRRIEADFDGKEQAHLSSPHLTTNVLREHGGLTHYGQQNLKGVEIYPVEYFYPYGWHEIFNPDRVKPHSHTIHWYGKSWVQDGQAEPLGRRIREKIHRVRWKLWKKRQILRSMQQNGGVPLPTQTAGK